MTHILEMETRADRIRFIREVLLGDISQEELADLMGVERGAVGNWERGKGIGRRNLAKLASLAGTTIDWIETGDGATPAKKGQERPAPQAEGMITVHRLAAAQALAAAFCRFSEWRLSPDLALDAATNILDALAAERVSGFRADPVSMAIGMGDATAALYLAQAGQKRPS